MRDHPTGIWHPAFPFAVDRFPVFYGWVIVFAATLGVLFSIPGQTMGFSVFTDMLMVELGLSRVALSTAYCLGTVASGLTLPRLGVLTDRWGERKMVVASSLVTGVVLLYLSVSPNLARALGGSPVAGFTVIVLGFYLIRASAQGVLTMVCRNAIGKWFNIRRGFALAVSSVVVSFGFSSAPKLLDLMIQRFTHQGAWLVMGLVTLGFMAPLGWLLFRDRPEDAGLVMDGRVLQEPGTEHEDMRIHREYSRREALATYTFWVFNLSFAWYGLYTTAFTFHIVSLGDAFGLSRSSILTLFMPMAAISVGTNLLFGWINTKMRLKWLLLIMNLGAVTGALGLMKLDTPAGVAAYVLGHGIGGGGFVSLLGIAYPRFFGRANLGAIAGMSMSCVVIGSGIGPLMFGFSEQYLGGYGAVLLGSIAVPALLAVLSLRANNPQHRH